MALQDERKAKRKRYMSRIITLKVGEAKEELSIHEDLLREDSPFFKVALEKKWAEGSSGVIELPEDDVDVVAAYIHWVCRREVVKAASQGRADLDFLANLYVFGERVQSDSVCNAALYAVLRFIDADPGHHWPRAKFVKTIYAGTTANCPARRFLVELYAIYAWTSSFTEDDRKEFPQDFLADLLPEFLARRMPGPIPQLVASMHLWEKK